jgi:hypothetical protein
VRLGELALSRPGRAPACQSVRIGSPDIEVRDQPPACAASFGASAAGWVASSAGVESAATKTRAKPTATATSPRVDLILWVATLGESPACHKPSAPVQSRDASTRPEGSQLRRGRESYSARSGPIVFTHVTDPCSNSNSLAMPSPSPLESVESSADFQEHELFCGSPPLHVASLRESGAFAAPVRNDQATRWTCQCSDGPDSKGVGRRRGSESSGLDEGETGRSGRGPRVPSGPHPWPISG